MNRKNTIEKKNIAIVRENIISSKDTVKMSSITNLTREFKSAQLGRRKQLTGNNFNKLYKSRNFVRGSKLNKAEKVEAVDVSFNVNASELRLRAKIAGVVVKKGQKIKSLIPSILHAENKFNKLKKQLILLLKGSIDSLDISLNRFTALEIIKTINEVLKRTPVVIEVNNVFYTLNQNTQERIREKIEDNNKIIFGIDESDNELIQLMKVFDKITVKLVTKRQKKKDGTIKKKSGGGFFNYTHNIDMDFSRYGLFKTVEKDNYNINCVVRAFENIGVAKNDIVDLRTRIKNRIIPMALLKKIAVEYNLYISVNKRDSHKDNYNYGNEKSAYKHINLGLIDEHFFLNDKETNITTYALKHYETVKGLKDWNTIYGLEGKYYRRTKTKFMKSFDLFEYLIKNKDRFLNEITNNNNEIFDTQFYDKVKSFEVLTYHKDCIRPVNKEPVAIKKPKKEDDEYEKIFFDFECTTDEEIHEPYQVSKIDINDKKTTYDGSNCGKQLLESLKCNTLLIAHNAGYDVRVGLIKYLHNLSYMEKGHSLIACSGLYTNNKKETIKIKIKDSYKLLSMKLSDFPKCFNLKQLKEIMPYAIYTKENIEKKYIPVSEALKHIKKKDHKMFKANLKKWDIQIGKEFDIMEYSKIYCEADCIVLKQGYETFRKWILEKPFELDIDNIISIASLADQYLIKKGCYNGVYECSGVIREFIQKCVVGGRTMLRDNKPSHIKKDLADYDGVSLYPSAMHRMAEKLGGFLMGKPKVIEKENLNYKALKKFDGYFVQIKITSVKKHLHFPLLSKINEKTGTRDFKNDMKDEIMFVDKIALKDLKKFQKVRFTIIKGYYFDEGRNPTIGKVIKELFEERLKKKEEKNPIQIVYKLIMNSAYGKTILKPIKTKTIIVNSKDKDDYVQRNYNFIVDYTQISNSQHWKVEQLTSIIRHYTRPHIGVEILSMSKRIMNEVMCLAEDKNLLIHYQDTDSMHIQLDQVEILEDAFRKKYKRELTGKNLGQFHIDFEIKGCKEATNIKSVESYFIAKKTYIDLLKYEDKDGLTKSDYHVRCKGIPNNTVKYTAHIKNISLMKLYDNLYKKKEVEFDMLKGLSDEGDIVSNCAFNYNKNMTINSRDSFLRTLNKRIKKEKK